MATAYHHEALRKARILERKRDALQRLTEQGGGEVRSGDASASYNNSDKLMDPQDHQTQQSRSTRRLSDTDKDVEEGVVFGKVTHDTNFNYRTLRKSGCAPLHVDRIYKVMYPGAIVPEGDQ